MLNKKYVTLIFFTVVASQLFLVTMAMAKTIHLTCRDGISEISINFKTKKVTYAVVGAARASFTTEAFITGNTVSFTFSRTSTIATDPLLKRQLSLGDITFEQVKEFVINRTNLELKTKYYTDATGIKGKVTRGAEGENTSKCEIQNTGKNKF